MTNKIVLMKKSPTLCFSVLVSRRACQRMGQLGIPPTPPAPSRRAAVGRAWPPVLAPIWGRVRRHPAPSPPPEAPPPCPASNSSKAEAAHPRPPFPPPSILG